MFRTNCQEASVKRNHYGVDLLWLSGEQLVSAGQPFELDGAEEVECRMAPDRIVEAVDVTSTVQVEVPSALLAPPHLLHPFVFSEPAYYEVVGPESSALACTLAPSSRSRAGLQHRPQPT